MNEESTIGLGWQIRIPVTPTATPLPTGTPTASPTPTETPAPDLSASEEPDAALTPDNRAKQNEGLLHAPKATARTYIISSIFMLMLFGAGLIGFRIFHRRKM